mmetsp:Transcript_10255/g.21637  ORF Transcript_10255/g.21637 Transcript_10255/m.21637 type:complete len:135 (+) Transcript_10255:951-1355(+)
MCEKRILHKLVRIRLTTIRNGGNDACNFGKDSHQNKPKTRCQPSTSGCALCYCDDAIILRECSVRHGCEEGGENRAYGICHETSLDALGVFFSVSGELLKWTIMKINGIRCERQFDFSYRSNMGWQCATKLPPT